MMKFFFSAIFLSLIPVASLADDPVEMRNWFQQDISVPYRLFNTTNINTLIALETSTGRVYQVHPGIGADSTLGVIAINDLDLAPTGEPRSEGRFTLYPTTNIFNFVLLDQISGAMWVVQWNYENNKRFIERLPLLSP
jgi:hypothetical protein